MGPEASPLACFCQSTAFKDILSDSVRSSPVFSVSNECYCSFKIFKHVVLFLSTVDLDINKIPLLLLSSVAENRYNTNCTPITSKIV